MNVVKNVIVNVTVDATSLHFLPKKLSVANILKQFEKKIESSRVGTNKTSYDHS